MTRDDGLPRSKWKLAEVKELMKDRDGETRGVVLRTVTKKGSHAILRRPVQRLCPLEVNSNTVSEQEKLSEEKNETVESSKQARRKAAIKADTVRRLFDQR